MPYYGQGDQYYDEVVGFSVSDIQVADSMFYFEIHAHYESGLRQRVARHEIRLYDSLELFEYHHRRMIELYIDEG